MLQVQTARRAGSAPAGTPQPQPGFQGRAARPGGLRVKQSKKGGAGTEAASVFTEEDKLRNGCFPQKLSVRQGGGHLLYIQSRGPQTAAPNSSPSPDYSWTCRFVSTISTMMSRSTSKSTRPRLNSRSSPQYPLFLLHYLAQEITHLSSRGLGRTTQSQL